MRIRKCVIMVFLDLQSVLYLDRNPQKEVMELDLYVTTRKKTSLLSRPIDLKKEVYY